MPIEQERSLRHTYFTMLRICPTRVCIVASHADVRASTWQDPVSHTRSHAALPTQDKTCSPCASCCQLLRAASKTIHITGRYIPDADHSSVSDARAITNVSCEPHDCSGWEREGTPEREHESLARRGAKQRRRPQRAE